MSNDETQSLLRDAPRLVALAKEKGWARQLLNGKVGTAHVRKGARVFSEAHKAAMRAARARKKEKQ